MHLPLAHVSLFNLLVNYRIVPLPKLIQTLRYQAEREPALNLSFTQILIAFNDLHHQKLLALRETFGELDEEPIGQLLVDSGRLSAGDLRRVRHQHPEQSLGTRLIRQELIAPMERECLFRELEGHCDPATPAQSKSSVLEVLKRRRQAMVQFKQTLWESELLAPEVFRSLGIWNLEYLPLRFKPLFDVLVLCGQFPAYLQPAMLIESVSFEAEPLLRLICRPGIADVQVLSRLMYLYDPAKDQGANPAVLLASHDLVARGAIVSAVQQAYVSLANERFSQAG